MQTLKGRTCVFAGATAGDGVDTVRALCAGGMNVIMMTHNAERARALTEEINAMGYEGQCAAIGATEKGPAEAFPETYDRIAAEYGSVDVIIANTGSTGPSTPMDEVETDDLMEGVRILCASAFSMMRAALPQLKKSRAPRIILMTSVEGVYGGTKESFINAVGKGAVNAIMKNAAARLAPEGICVNAIAKGAIPRIEGIREGEADPADMLPFIPMGRMGTAKDLAELICFLASEESGYVTGQTITLGGGL